jgi:hypothetical protein
MSRLHPLEFKHRQICLRNLEIELRNGEVLVSFSDLFLKLFGLHLRKFIYDF